MTLVYNITKSQSFKKKNDMIEIISESLSTITTGVPDQSI